MENLPLSAILEILRSIGSPLEFVIISCVSHSWDKILNGADGELWSWMAAEYKVAMHSLTQKRSLRSTSNYRNVFMKAYLRANYELKEKHENLLLQARSLFGDDSRDCSGRLSSLITGIFPDLVGFDVNWTSSVVEGNTLATMCSRGSCRPKCLRLLLETYSGNIELGDMGGFNPLILNAYYGNLSCTVYCVKRGANLFAMGRERSGLSLIAEHWASICGHSDVFQYLRTTRIKLQKKIFLSTQSNVSAHSSKGVVPQNCKSLIPTDSRSPIIHLDGSPCSSVHLSDHDQSLGRVIDNGNLMTPTRHRESCSTSLFQMDLFDTPILSIDSMSTSAVDASTSSASADSVQMQPDCYCVCSRGHVGSMVLCDGPDCYVGWYHYSCVGLTEDVLEDESWLCPFCDGDDALGGLFPEPRPSVYSSFLTQTLPPLSVNTPMTLRKSRAMETSKRKKKDSK